MTDVVHLIHALNDRTIAAVVRSLAVHMQSAGTGTVVVASSVSQGALRPAGVEVIDLGGSGRRTLPTLGTLRRTLRALRPTIVFAHGEGPARAAVVATRGVRARPRVVGIVHNHYSSYPWQARRIRLVVDSLVLPRLDALVGVSPGVAGDLRATFPAVAPKVHVIPAPLTRWEEFASLRADAVDHPWLVADRPLLVSVGHLHPRKDQETLVRALALLARSEQPAPRLVIIGADGTAYADLVRRVIHDLDLESDVDLVGRLANPLPYIAAADALVLSSTNEGMGIVLLEAMASGTPVISTDAPSGPRWLLDDGRAGLLAPVGDASALAAAIRRVLHDDDLRTQLIEAGRARVAGFAPSKVAGRYLELAAALR